MENIIDTTNTALTNSTPEENGGSSEKMFTQDDVNRIVSERLARERERLTQQPKEDEREQALKARENKLDCRDYLDAKKYPAALLDVLDTSDAEKFKAAVDSLVQIDWTFLNPQREKLILPKLSYSGSHDAIADAFKPKI